MHCYSFETNPSFLAVLAQMKHASISFECLSGHPDGMAKCNILHLLGTEGDEDLSTFIVTITSFKSSFLYHLWWLWTNFKVTGANSDFMWLSYVHGQDHTHKNIFISFAYNYIFKGSRCWISRLFRNFNIGCQICPNFPWWWPPLSFTLSWQFQWLVEFKVTATFERLKFCFFTMFLIFIKPSDIDTNINIMHICI